MMTSSNCRCSMRWPAPSTKPQPNHHMASAATQSSILPTLDIASRSIREKVRSGRCIRGLVPPEVEKYIAEHSLYRGTGEEEPP